MGLCHLFCMFFSFMYYYTGSIIFSLFFLFCQLYILVPNGVLINRLQLLFDKSVFVNPFCDQSPIDKYFKHNLKIILIIPNQYFALFHIKCWEYKRLIIWNILSLHS